MTKHTLFAIESDDYRVDQIAEQQLEAEHEKDRLSATASARRGGACTSTLIAFAST
jgi:hypothetical protein